MNDKLKAKNTTVNDKIKVKDTKTSDVPDPSCCTAPPDGDPGPIKP